MTTPVKPPASMLERVRSAGNPSTLSASTGRSGSGAPARSVPKNAPRLGRGPQSPVSKPLGRFPNFDACIAEMSATLGSDEAARRYCGKLQSLVEGGNR